MPEGNILHRIARIHGQWLVGRSFTADSPQGRFSAGARHLSGRALVSVDAHGKHLFHHFEGGVRLHIHLGLVGHLRHFRSRAPPPSSACRLRLSSLRATLHLAGPQACELLSPEDEATLRSRLGQDPLRPDASPSRAFEALRRGRGPLAVALLDQERIAGVGNILRAEALFLARLPPLRPASELSLVDFERLWEALRLLMEDAARDGRIVAPHAPRLPGRLPAGGARIASASTLTRAIHVPGAPRPSRAWSSPAAGCSSVPAARLQALPEERLAVLEPLRLDAPVPERPDCSHAPGPLVGYNPGMFRRTTLAAFSLTLAACTTPQHNTREVLQRADTRFFIREQCQPKSTASLSRAQVTGLDELPASLRDQLLADLPVEAAGSRPFIQCQDVAARLLEDRLHALCWPEARVTWQADTGTGTPATQPRLSVQLGVRYQVDAIWVVQGKNATVPAARIIKAAQSALPKDKACTARTFEDIRTRVSRLGTFHRVLVVPGPPGEQKKVPVVVDISEMPPASQTRGK